MNEEELKKLWQGYDQKIEKILHINRKQLQVIQSEKALNRIRSFKSNHILAVLLGLVWIFILAFLLWYAPNNLFFRVSVGMILLFNIFAVLLYAYHIVLLSTIDISASITSTQARLKKVYHSYLHVGRVLLLQTPFYCTWWYSVEFIKEAGILFWIINVPIVMLFTSLALWAFIRLSPKSKPTKWTKRLNNWFGSRKLEQASAFLEETEEYTQEKE